MNSNPQVTKAPIICNEHGQSFRSGSLTFKYPNLDRVLYVHVEAQEMVEYKGKKIKPASLMNHQCPAHVFTQFVESRKHTLNNDEQRIQGYIEEAQALRKNCQVGDIFYASWGSEQTNINYYQLTEIKGQTCTFREIQSERIEGKTETGVSSMTGKCVPMVGQFKNDKLIQKRFPKCGNFALESYMFLYPLEYSVDSITGSRIYKAKNYSSYA